MLRELTEVNAAAASGLNDAVLAASRLIGSNPKIGAWRPQLASRRYRFWSIPRYRYLLIYTDTTNPPRILRLVHTSRDLQPLLTQLPNPPDPLD